jgi:RimJ/RimL family protein N-acetyltransferase
MEQLKVRPATLNDLENLLEFEQAMIVAERPFDETIRTGDDVLYYDLEGLITSPNVEIVVAEHGSEIIGCGYARIEDSEPYLRHKQHAYLGFMYVVPEHRGKGVNKAVMKALEQWSFSKGVLEMRLEVYTTNVAAIRAYKKVGFTPHMLEMRLELSKRQQKSS